MDANHSALVVEDDAVIRSVLVETLTDEGWTVREANDGATALAELEAWRPSVIVLDLAMPTMDGWEFCERLGQDPALASIPVVVVSGVGDCPERLASLHPAARLSKTADLATLLDTVRQHCTGGPDEGHQGGGR